MEAKYLDAVAALVGTPHIINSPLIIHPESKAHLNQLYARRIAVYETASKLKEAYEAVLEALDVDDVHEYAERNYLELGSTYTIPANWYQRAEILLLSSDTPVSWWNDRYGDVARFTCRE